MKPLSFIFAVALGAAIATWGTHRWLSGKSREVVSVASADARGARAVQTTVTVDSADAEERERLRKENADLKARLAEAQEKLSKSDVSLQVVREQLDELRRPMEVDMMSSALRAEMKSGEVVVTGGYKLADGRRLYAFAKPTVKDVAGTPVVMIEGSYLTLTDDAGRSVGLDNLATNAANTLQHGEVWVPDEATEVLGKLKGAEGTDVLTTPVLNILPGQSGVVSVGGTQLKITPSLLDRGDGLDVEIRLEQPLVSAEAGGGAAALAR